MDRRIITINLAFAALCSGARAQPKKKRKVPACEKRGYDKHMSEHSGIYGEIMDKVLTL